tara:strand:+ start:4031 stop:5074 length:1044 start_codon:yes stop_codon:yes gene_type:complete
MKLIKNLEEVLIPEELPLQEALVILDNNGLQILMLESKDKKLTGIVTDGDIRRFILKDGSLDIPVSSIANRNYIKLSEVEIEKADSIFLNNDFNHIPVVDKKGQLKSLIVRKDEVIENEVPVVIVAGGKGTRLAPMTKIIPKPLMPVGDATMLEKIINNFLIQGFSNFKVIVNYKKDLIKSYMKEVDYKYDLEFIDEEIYGGTAGCLALLEGELGEDPFVVTNCDIVANCDYQSLLDWHKQRNADLTILGVRKEMDVPYGVVIVDRDSYVTEVQEKPTFNHLIVSGIYVLNPSVLKLIPKDEPIGMDELISKLIKNKCNVTCYPIKDGWFDIGQFDEYKKLIHHLGD